jgi:transglutaminase-like putative cysteine protease
MRYRITHRTEYRYSEPVDSGYNEARLLPRALDRQQVLCASLAIDPPASDQRERSDYFGNRVVAFSLDRPHRVPHCARPPTRRACSPAISCSPRRWCRWARRFRPTPHPASRRVDPCSMPCTT